MGSATRIRPGYVGGYPPLRGPGAQPADGGSARYPSDLIPPGAAVLWYDAQDINLLGNVGINDADPIGTWKNKGSLGSAADLLQASAPNRPLFRKIAAVGKINNLSALEGDGARFMASSAFTVLAQPSILAIVYKVTNLAVTHTVFDGGTGGVAATNLSVLITTGVEQLFSGAAGATQAIPAATWETAVAKFNGATSFNRLNGSQSGNVNAGATGCAGASVFAFNGGTLMVGMISEVLLYNGALPVLTDLEAYLSAKHGVTPQ